MAEIKDFPSNSKTAKAQQEKKELSKVVTGSVEVRQKSNFMESFFGDDLESVGGYILNDVIIPALKNTISDVVGNGIDMLLFGQTKGSRTYRRGGGSYVSYSNYGSRYGRDTEKPPWREDTGRPVSRAGRDTSRDLEDVSFETRGDAEEVLSQLVDLIYDYGQATVADFYDLSGISGEFTDNKYGWEHLDTASVQRDRRGRYYIRFPRVKAL